MASQNINKNSDIKIKYPTKHFCYVPECNSSTNDATISLHSFPNIGLGSRRNKWFLALKMIPRNYKTNWRVCNKHFEDSDFYPRQCETKKKVLKKNAIPSKNLPGKTNTSQYQRKLPLQREPQPSTSSNLFSTTVKSPINQNSAMHIDELLQPLHNSYMDIEEETEDLAVSNIKSYAEVSTQVNLLDWTNNIQNMPSDKFFVDASTQVNFNTLDLQIEHENEDLSILNTSSLKTYADSSLQINTLDDFKFSDPTFIENLKNNKDLHSWAGLSSFTLLRNIETCVNNIASAKDFLNKIKNFISVEGLIVLVMLKLKVNLTFTQMRVLFNMTRQKISNYFFKFLPILRAALKPAIYWPSKEEIKNNLPACFIPKFMDCVAVSDCTEMPIETPKTLPSRLKCFSHYKGKYTAKVQITISPHGQIIHLSKAYGGKASDKFIMNKEKVLDLLSESDAIMVDKGYDIDKECFEKGIKLYRPPFLHGPQLSRMDSIRNTSIAASRVHVERVIQRIKLFEIFNTKFPNYLIKHIDDIMNITCCIVNLSPPILAESKN